MGVLAAYVVLLFNFYGADGFCYFSRGDLVKFLYPRHSVPRAGEMKANLTVQDIKERDLWHRHPISRLISLARDLDCIGGVCRVAVLFQKLLLSLPYAVPFSMSEFHTENISF